jgi:RNA polymerase sigma-B factor
VLEEGTPECSYARNTLIEMNMSLVRFAAGRFRSRGPEDMGDIVQVGMIGLIKAIDRFVFTREVEFTSFAIPYIVGEIKRFFRDTTWAVHVPRRLRKGPRPACPRHRRAPQPSGAHADGEGTVGADEPARGRGARGAPGLHSYNSSSLDAAISGSEEGESALADFIGAEDRALELVEDFHALAPLIAALDARDRQIIHMCFVEELTQAQIGECLGVSQMHVSRLLSRTLARLREGMITTH